VGHIFAVAVVPLANIYAVWAMTGYEHRRLESVIFAQGVAVAVAGVYTLIFLPIVPLGLMMVPFGVLYCAAARDRPSPLRAWRRRRPGASARPRSARARTSADPRALRAGT